MGKHDQLFKDTFRDPARAAGELASVLPKEVIDAIDLKTLVRVPGDTVSRQQRNERFADALFKADFKAGGTGFIWLLLEHQSEPDRWMLLRALEQVARVWRAWVTDNPRATLLPPFICLVVHHGERGWNVAGRLHDLVAGLREVPTLKRYVPDFELLVDDLARVPDSQLLRRPLDTLAKVVLWALRDARSNRLRHTPRAWGRMLGQLDAGAPEDMAMVLRYIWEVAGSEALENIMMRLADVAPATEEKMQTIAQALRAEGMKLGKLQGEKRGERRGKAESVLAVLEARGLAVTEKQRELIVTCRNLSTLNRWLRLAATTRKTASLFEG